jgi:GWxTD domain-containing protein
MQLATAFRRIGLTGILTLALLAIAAGSPQSAAKKAGQRNREESHSAYKRWVDEVSNIITPAERLVFGALKTDEERDHFIEMFWLKRDPDPDTPENEYREQYYERVQYANEHFSAGVPGVKTDRGRIYVTFGKPDNIESHPSGGSYNRPSWEGGGSTATYPFEIWWYRNIEGVGTDVEIEFVDLTGSGEYRIARNPYEKDALLNVPGAGPTLGELLNLDSRTDRVSAASGIGAAPNGLFGTRTKDQQFEWMQRMVDLQRPPALKFPEIAVRADLPELAADALPFAVRADFTRLSSELAVASIAIQFEHADLSFTNRGGVYSGTVNLHARITGLAETRPTVFEEVIQTARYTDDTLKGGLSQKSIYEKNVPLKPGRYKLDIVARDVVSGKTGVVHQALQVPRYPEKLLSASSLVLAELIERFEPGRIQSGQFVKGQYKVRPSVGVRYKPGQALTFYLQVYDAEMDEATLTPALSIEYSISRGAVEVTRFKEDGKSGAIDLRGQQLVVTRSIPLAGELAQAGSYSLTVTVTDLVAQRTVSRRTSYEVAAY